MKHCPFCGRTMEETSRGMETSHHICGLCGYEDIYGPYKLPDPERLRSRGEDLLTIADALESGGDPPAVAAALERALGGESA